MVGSFFNIFGLDDGYITRLIIKMFRWIKSNLIWYITLIVIKYSIMIFKISVNVLSNIRGNSLVLKVNNLDFLCWLIIDVLQLATSLVILHSDF